MIAVILNLAILTFLQYSTNYQPDISYKFATTSGINYYHNLIHTNNAYQNIKQQNGARFNRILRRLPQESDEILRSPISLQMEEHLGGISPEVLALYPLLPTYDHDNTLLIVNDLNDEEDITQGQNNYESILIEFLMDAAQSAPASATNTNTASAETNLDESNGSSAETNLDESNGSSAETNLGESNGSSAETNLGESNGSSAETNLGESNGSNASHISSEDSIIMDRLNLIYRMDALWELSINNMFSQYNELADSLQLIQESRLVIWNQTWRPHLESMLNTVVLLFENYNMSISEIEAQVISIIERAKLDFQVFLTSTRDAVLQALGTNNITS
ncbi:Plasmodium exported protein, unknown function [Plasmodium vinckei brucechwatti]|uniref:Plasmodium RESA N-terminal domain-containing protein n=1 Tax=Plasmodium vinckei brucechwatti TaxID=119398 RepID=A0A6V7S0S7_PLAVN|nr:Plasmodium exported protein, unknown function [Plasmodium vinckei brucechwatti]